MPTYEYACTKCGAHIEVVQSFTDEPLTTCEKCGGALRRVFHPVGVLFKGSGFYSTDSRSRKKGAGIKTPKDRSETSDKSSKTKESGSKTSEKSA